MSNDTIIYVVAGASATLALAAYVAFILVPAWQAYARVWQRLAASFLTLYVVAAFVLLGIGGGAAIVWFYDRWAA